MEKTNDNIETKQFNIELFDDVDAEMNEVLDRVPGLTKKVLGNIALREKVRKLKRRLDRGDQVAISI